MLRLKDRAGRSSRGVGGGSSGKGLSLKYGDVDGPLRRDEEEEELARERMGLIGGMGNWELDGEVAEELEGVLSPVLMLGRLPACARKEESA